MSRPKEKSAEFLQLGGTVYVEVPAGKTYTYTLNVVLDEALAKRTRQITVSVTPASRPDYRREYRLGYVSVL